MRSVLRFVRFVVPLHALALTVLAPLAACGGSASPPNPTGSNESNYHSATCIDEQQRADAYLGSHVHEWSDVSCKVNSDCQVAPGVPRCETSCGGEALVNTAGATALARAIATIDATICTSGCPDGPQPPCAAIPYAGPSCVHGACGYYSVAAWTSITVREASTDPPTTCTTTSPCREWTITPDAKVTIDGVATPLSPADFASVDGILRSDSFRTAPGGCPTPSASSSDRVTLSVVRPDGSPQLSEDVSGCVASASASDAKTLVDVARSYGP